MNLYSNLLQPELYFEQPKIARFVETLSEPEIESASYDKIQLLRKEMMATDDINTLAEDLSVEARENIENTGTISPQFIVYTNREHRIKFESDKVPQTHNSVKNFLLAGKALGLSRASQCVFFVAMQPLKDDHPVSGDDVSEFCSWGILVIGSSLRGNCFVHLERVINEENLQFEKLHHKIMREGEYDYPYSNFFHIEDHNEMAGVIEQTLKFSASMSERECLINFATTLKALDFFGYSVSRTS